MRSITVRLKLLVGVFVLLAAGCAPTAAPTTAPSQVSAPTLAPALTDAPVATQALAPTAVPPTSVLAPEPAATTPADTSAPTAASAANSDGGLPETVSEGEGNTYVFQVDPSQTTVEYAVDEVLFGNQRITRGSTNAVEGDFKLGVKDGKPYFDFSKLRVDLRTLRSDNGMRDAAIQRQWLESGRFPYAEFVVTSVEEFPADASAGQDVKFKVSGDMTIREITKPITFEVTVKLDGDTLIGTGVTQIMMKDFGFEPPEILGRFTVSDPATITITGVAKYLPENS